MTCDYSGKDRSNFNTNRVYGPDRVYVDEMYERSVYQDRIYEDRRYVEGVGGYNRERFLKKDPPRTYNEAYQEHTPKGRNWTTEVSLTPTAAVSGNYGTGKEEPRRDQRSLQPLDCNNRLGQNIQPSLNVLGAEQDRDVNTLYRMNVSSERYKRGHLLQDRRAVESHAPVNAIKATSMHEANFQRSNSPYLDHHHLLYLKQITTENQNSIQQRIIQNGQIIEQNAKILLANTSILNTISECFQSGNDNGIPFLIEMVEQNIQKLNKNLVLFDQITNDMDMLHKKSGDSKNEL